MLIYYILLFYIVALYIIMFNGVQKYALENDVNADSHNFSRLYLKRRKSYIIMVGLAVFLIMALRSETVGSDIQNYLDIYQNQTIIIVEKFIRNLPALPSISNDPLYFTFGYILQQIGIDFRWYLVIVSFIMVVSLLKLYNKYSENTMVSSFLFVTIGLFTIFNSGLRQSLALAIIAIAFHYLQKGKPIKYFLLVFLAMGFHATALIMIPIYFIRKIRLSSVSRIVLLAVSVVGSFVLQKLFVLVLLRLNLTSRFSQYLEPGNPVNPLVIVVAIGITLAALMLYNPKEQLDVSNNHYDLFFTFSCINIAILIFSVDYAMISRFAYYFEMFIPIMLANALSNIKSWQNRLIMISVCLMVALLQFVITTPGDFLAIDNYKFFWQ